MYKALDQLISTTSHHHQTKISTFIKLAEYSSLTSVARTKESTSRKRINLMVFKEKKNTKHYSINKQIPNKILK